MSGLWIEPARSPDNIRCTHPFMRGGPLNPFGVSPQVLHEPFSESSLHPNFRLSDGDFNEDADGDNESDNAADEGGNVTKIATTTTTRDISDERPEKRVTLTLPWCPLQGKSVTPFQAQSSSPTLRRPTRRIRNVPPTRKIQASITCGTAGEARDSLKFRCPVAGSRYRTVGRHIPDLKHHLKTQDAGRCTPFTGVILSDAERAKTLYLILSTVVTRG
ncbi:hypothetical protein CVT25_006901 [Psilocybe cyanescens]|uniref:Uncharacterized protein n=1 Tax=Psilocybe cyanescens TaxID=93625 RepID=A0A409X663_PSICY|nr:hypothetical protein CVT25_006901 [Psilocybe cyanescens]